MAAIQKRLLGGPMIECRDSGGLKVVGEVAADAEAKVQMNNPYVDRLVLGMCLMFITGCIVDPNGNSDFQQSVEEASRSVPGDAELKFIAKTGLPFPKSARLLDHLLDERERYETWLLLCPRGTHPLMGEHGQIPIEDFLAYASKVLGRRNVGKPLNTTALTYRWKKTFPWRATVASTDQGD